MPQLTLTLLRGLPGSGKSTLAKTYNAQHLETDMFFLDNNGNYLFNAHLLTAAHNWCQQQCEMHLSRGEDVVVANTFVKHWEMNAYRSLAEKYRAKLVVHTCTGQYQNQHAVPEKVIQKMQKQWQP